MNKMMSYMIMNELMKNSNSNKNSNSILPFMVMGGSNVIEGMFDFDFDENNEDEGDTAAWYFGLNHTKLDCWNRDKKGIIITMGDEPLNPYLPKRELTNVIGNKIQADIETEDLYKEVSKKFDIYHIAVNDRDTLYKYYVEEIKDSFGKYLDENHLFTAGLNDISKVIVDIISKNSNKNESITNTEISW